MVDAFFVFLNHKQKMKIHQRVLLVVWLLIIALLPVRAATYKGTITVRVGETTRVNIGSGYMGTEIITSGYWDKSNSTFIIESVSGMYHKECTIRGNKVGSGKLYWDGYIFGDAWSFYWDVNVIQDGGSQPGSSDIWYENDYGKWGDITIKYGDTKTLSHKFPSSVMNSRVNWEWCLRDGNLSEHLLDDCSVKITSQSVSSCTIKGVGPNLYIPSRLYYYVQTGTYNGSKVYAVGYYEIKVDYAGKVTTSSNRPSGTYEEGTKIYLTPSVSGGEIFYTTDGSEPDWASTFYTNEGITLSKSMTLKARAYAYGYSSDVVNSWTYTVAKTGIDINSTNFPDASFRSWLLSQSYGADGKLTESEISNIVSISVSGSYSSPGTIKSLKGIEYFTSLKYLYCSYNQLTSLDVSKLTALTSLSCYNNQLTSLDVSKLTALTSLSCSNNQLTSLDVSKQTSLTSLSCYNNQLTSLDVSKQTSLTSLSCDNNQLTSLDVSRLTALTSLSCDKNQLTSLNVSNLTALKSLYCSNNQLTSLDVSRLTALTSLSCDDNQLTSLDVSRLTALTFLSCYNNQLKLLDVSNLTALETLQCFDNQLTSLDVSRLTALTFLSCSDNQLTTLNVSNLTALKSLYCSNNQLITLNVSKLTALKYLYCDHNQLTSLDVSRLTALTSLWCDNNLLTSLDASNLTALQSLSCGNNQLTSLDVSRLTALTSLYCYNNQLTSLDASNLTALQSLSCGNNQLTSLNVSNLTALTDLYCYNNQLTSLDVSKNTALTLLSCYNNSIKGAAMDNLISSLPKNNSSEVHRFRVVGEDLSNEGNVCTTTQVAAVKAKGWFPCYYDSTTKEYVEYEGSDGTTGSKGDVNGDNQVNGTDLVALTNIILGKNAQTTAADVNGDGYVNGTDYVALANIVLGRSNAKASAMAKGAVQAVATTGLTIEPFDIKAGESKEMVIDLTNPNDEITLVQFDLRLPAGLSVKQNGGEYDFDIAGRTTWRKHSLDANATNGIVRFLLASSSNATLTGTEGAVIKITVQADNSFTGGDIQLENILMVTPAEKEIKQDTYTYPVGQSQPSVTSTGLAIEPFNISAGGEAEMVIDLNNPDDEITLAQFDLRLPNGLSVKQSGGEYDFDIAGRTTWRKHSLDANATNGIVRFLLASSSNATLTGTEGAVIKITLPADNSFAGGAVKLENILLVTPAEKEIKQSDVNYAIGTTGIKRVVADNIEKDAVIYSPSGQRLSKPRKGINIIDGKKVMVN